MPRTHFADFHGHGCAYINGYTDFSANRYTCLANRDRHNPSTDSARDHARRRSRFNCGSDRLAHKRCIRAHERAHGRLAYLRHCAGASADDGVSRRVESWPSSNRPKGLVKLETSRQR